MFSKILASFFRANKVMPSLPPREWLNAQFIESGLEARFPPSIRDRTKNTAKVFYNQHYFPNAKSEGPYSVNRALSKIPAVNVSGDRQGYFQNGTSFQSDAPSFFSRIQPTHPTLLSPLERLSGAKKVIYSNSSVFASGGYPMTNPQKPKKKPHDVGIFSLAGASFENNYLHNTLFMLDPVNQKINNPLFAHLYKDLPTDFKEAQSLLGPYDGTSLLSCIRIGLPLLARSAPEKFYASFYKKNAVIFLSEAYFRYQLEDISLLLTAVNQAAKESGKPALLKATAVGMGFFAKVNGSYDIQHILYPHYLRAFQKLLIENSYPWIAKIEFPTFNEQQEEQYDLIFDKPIEPVDVYQTGRDVLEFTEEETEKYYPCVINPSDAFAYAGNEWAFSSVEAMIGLSSSLRMDQIPLENPLLLDHDHQIPVLINSKSFSAEILVPNSNNLHL